MNIANESENIAEFLNKIKPEVNQDVDLQNIYNIASNELNKYTTQEDNFKTLETNMTQTCKDLIKKYKTSTFINGNDRWLGVTEVPEYLEEIYENLNSLLEDDSSYIITENDLNEVEKYVLQMKMPKDIRTLNFFATDISEVINPVQTNSIDNDLSNGRTM